jgi:signal transduction histidine kinase
MLDAIRAIPLFARLPQDELDELLSQSRVITLPAGEYLFHDGDAPTGFYVILEGELEISKVIGGQTIVLAKEQPGSFVGEIALLTGQARTASGRATVETQLLEFDRAVVESVSHSSPIAELLMTTMAKRLRDTEAQIRGQEKMSALGKLAAGLAHELNNPAAANVRAARQTPALLAELQRHTLALSSVGLSAEQIDLISRTAEALMSAPPPPPLSALAQNDRESALADWLEDHNVADAWAIAPVLVSEGIGTDMLEMFERMMPAGSLPAVAAWLASTVSIMGLSRTAANSATRISEMINAVKAYTYMDEAPLQIVDLHEGIENTLTMLSNRLSKVTVTRDFDRSCPRLNVYASELNQVWTKLIENALDAMGDRGALTISTRLDEDGVHVSITDSGRGIPPEVQPRVFEPFFSTKPMGTGLGLDIARRIVREKHRGDIRFTSRPGETCFTVTLPHGGAEG